MRKITIEQEKEPFDTDYFARLRAVKAIHEFRGTVRAMVVAKKWMRKSLHHLADPSHSLGIDQQCMEIPVNELKAALEEFKANSQDFKVNFRTFAAVVSSVESLEIFCSVVFFNMFDPQGIFYLPFEICNLNFKYSNFRFEMDGL